MVYSAGGSVDVAIAGENAILAIDDGGDQIAFRVDGGDAFTIDDGTGFWGKVIPDLVQHLFQFVNFFHGDGGSCFALNTAFSTAGLKVAAEVFGKDIGREQDFAHLKYG